MKTIIVMFDGNCKKKYAYNTDSEVATGDVLVSPEYDNKMTSLNQNLIRTLKVAADKVDQTVICIRLTK